MSLSEDAVGRVMALVSRLEAMTSPVCLGYQGGDAMESRVFASAYTTFGLRIAAFYIGCIVPTDARERVLLNAIETLKHNAGTVSALADQNVARKTAARPTGLLPSEPASTPEEQAVAERDMLELLAKMQGKGEQDADQ